MEIDLSNVQKKYESILKELSDPKLISDWPSSAPASAEAASFAEVASATKAESAGRKATEAGEKFKILLERKAFLEKIIEKEKEIRDLKSKIEENKDILKSNEDLELSSLAEVEINQLTERLKNLEKEIQELLNEHSNKTQKETALPEQEKSKETPLTKAVIVEIRAGTGGQEAALFAADLFRMYSKYSQSRGWEQKVLDSRPAELGGLKEIIFELKSAGKSEENVWNLMKYEAGVHRVQRVPLTEKSGRIHTSTASVAVLPRPQKGKITINQNDLKIDTYKASGPGGQYVNKRMTAVRITHLPTALVVTSQTERNLQQNRENALSILEARLLEKKETEQASKMGKERRSQIGKAQRAEKIRTYNFPQNRITDHRIKKSFHNLEQIMEGKLDRLLNTLSKSN